MMTDPRASIKMIHEIRKALTGRATGATQVFAIVSNALFKPILGVTSTKPQTATAIGLWRLYTNVALLRIH